MRLGDTRSVRKNDNVRRSEALLQRCVRQPSELYNFMGHFLIIPGVYWTSLLAEMRMQAGTVSENPPSGRALVGVGSWKLLHFVPMNQPCRYLNG